MSIPIYYVEPNDLEFKNEDLCIGVKLEVDVPGRALSSHQSNNTGNTMSWSTIIDNVDLFGNKDGDFLTTSYSDISSLDPHNGGNMDSIGIEYINIRYNSWMFPEVDIKFIDLRGNALMNPMESRRDDRSKKGSFLNALFSFPYPLFRLTVKGYYGKPVTYKLTVRDVRSNFNASTGNFEISVKFIGYMYGYLNDLPMSYLLIAPYIEYGGEDSYLGNFSYNISGSQSSAAIPTFSEFISKISNAINNSNQKENLTSEKNAADNYEEAKSLLNNIKKGISRLSHDLEESRLFNCQKETMEVGDTIVIKYTLTKRSKTEDDEVVTDVMVNNLLTEWNNQKKGIVKLYNTYNSKSYGSVYPLAKLNISDVADFKLDNDTKTFFTFEWKKDSDENNVKNLIDGYTNLIEKQNEKIKNAINEIYTTAIGWDPTIGNVIQMVLAHLDKFYNNVRRCMDNIDGHRAIRNLSKINYKTDCSYVGNEDLTVPPFPLLTNTDKKYVWIGETDSVELRNYDEKWLVESVIDGAISQAEDAADALSEFDTVSKWTDFPKGGIPTLLSDLYMGERGNPYENCRIETSDGSTPDALKVFAKRLVLRYLFNGGTDSSLPLKAFAEAEAINFFNRNCQSTKKDILLYNSLWTNSDVTTKAVRDYLGKFLEKYNVEKEYSIIYSDYANREDIGENGRRGDMMRVGTTFSEKSSTDNIMGYDKRINRVMSWINSQNGMLDGYSTVFPQIIKRKYDYFNDDIIRSNENFNNRGLILKDKKGKDNEYSKVLSGDIPSDLIWSVGTRNGNRRSIREFFENINFDKIQCFGACLPVSPTEVNNLYAQDIVSWIKKNPTATTEKKLNRFFIQLGLLNPNGRENSRGEVFEDASRYLINEPNKGGVGKLQNYGIFKLPKLLYVLYGYIKKNGGGSFGSLETVFNDAKYNAAAEELCNKIKELSDFCTEDLKTSTAFGQSVYALSKNAIDVLRQIFEEDVVIYNLHGEYNTPFNVNSKGKQKKGMEYVCTACITGQVIKKGDKENENTGENAVEYFINKIQSLVKEITNSAQNVENSKETYASSNKKLSVYLTLKELYDRWKFGAWRTNDNVKQEFQITMDNFVFIDSHYSDIKNEHLVNIDDFANLIKTAMTNSGEMSVYSFIHQICANNNIVLSALPVNMYEYLSSDEEMKNMFRAYPYMSVDDSAMQTTYVGVYTHRPSSHLNNTNPYNGYDDDGVDFLQKNDFVQKNNDPNMKNIPVFGVTFGLGKQRFFKDISVGMDNPKTTAHSIMSELLISQQGSSGANALGFEAHDIFDVYANKSYTCKVEMMGNVQIMPMTYFQLNNIPLFKGGYYIINVEHSITKNGMTTTFTGVRLSRNRFDLKDKEGPNIASLPSMSIDSQVGNSGGYETEPYYSTKSSVNIRTSIPYSKYNTIIMIDAGHDMKTSGKQSPAHDMITSSTFTNGSTLGTEIWRDTNVLQPDLDNGTIPGTMRANYPNSTSAFSPNEGVNGEGKARYREYWGNRKIAEALKKELERRGYPTGNIQIVSSTGVTAEAISDFSGKVNGIYDENEGNCILVSIHSNAIGDGEKFMDANYWEVYRQSNEYMEKYSTYKEAPHIDVSTKLANCMISAAKKAFNEMPYDMYSDIGHVRVCDSPKTFVKSYQGIRPTTYSLAPTVLTENLFHTNKGGVRLLGSKEGAQFFAKLHADGIDLFFEQVTPPNKREEKPVNFYEDFKNGFLGNSLFKGFFGK